MWTECLPYMIIISDGILPSGRLGAKVLGTSVLEYRFCSTRRYSVLVLFKSTCTCTRVLLKMKVLLMSTYELFTSTSHLKLIQNNLQTNQNRRDIQLM